MTNIVLLLVMAFTCAGNSTLGQQPSQPAAPIAPAPPGPPNAPNPTPPAKGIPTKTIPGFLIIGTVFNENALSFPGVEVRIRLAGEKKYRWETYTNSRGEFAVRVPEGRAYELLVRVKKYQEHRETVTTANNDIQQRLSIRLQPINAGKTGAKP
jgi:hypothetical protein